MYTQVTVNKQDYIDKAHVPLARSQAACRPRTWSVQ
jgi:hypothetical protein